MKRKSLSIKAVLFVLGLFFLWTFSQYNSLPQQSALEKHTGKLQGSKHYTGRRSGIFLTLKNEYRTFYYSPDAGKSKEVYSQIVQSQEAITAWVGRKIYRPDHPSNKNTREIFQIAVDGSVIRTYDEISKSYSIGKYVSFTLSAIFLSLSFVLLFRKKSI